MMSKQEIAFLWKLTCAISGLNIRIFPDLRGHSSGILCVCFSPDGTKIATGSYDKLSIIWDAKTGS